MGMAIRSAPVTPAAAQRAPRGPGAPDPSGALAQVREAYLQFMVSVATMLRADVSLPRDGPLVREDMAQVLRLETQLANVRPGCPRREGYAQALATTPGHRPPAPHAGHGPPGGEA